MLRRVVRSAALPRTAAGTARHVLGTPRGVAQSPPSKPPQVGPLRPLPRWDRISTSISHEMYGSTLRWEEGKVRGAEPAAAASRETGLALVPLLEQVIAWDGSFDHTIDCTKCTEPRIIMMAPSWRQRARGFRGPVFAGEFAGASRGLVVPRSLAS